MNIRQSMPVWSSILLAALMLIILFSCRSSKVSTTSKFIGVSTGDRLLVCDLTGNNNKDYQDLTVWATETLKTKSGVEPVAFSDSDFKLKQFGIELSKMNDIDSATSKIISDKLNLDFILLTSVGRLNDNLEGETHNPNYQVREADLTLKLYNLKLRRLVWRCDIETTVSPLIFRDKEMDYNVNLPSSDYALNRGYRKGIQRMIKSFKEVQ